MSAYFLPENQQFAGLHEPLVLEDDCYQQQADDSFFNFNALGEGEVDDTDFSQYSTSFLDSLPSFDEMGVKGHERRTTEKNEASSSRLESEGWSTSSTHCTTHNADDDLELGTMEPSMCDWSHVHLNDHAFAASYIPEHIRPLDLSQESVPILPSNNLSHFGTGLAPEVANSHTPKALIRRKRSVSFSTHVGDNELIDGESLFLEKLFRCIGNLSLKDMYAIAEEFGFTFESVCDLYCQSQASSTSSAPAIHDTATINQRVLGGETSQNFSVSTTVDSGYGTGTEGNRTIDEHRSKRSRSEKDSAPYSRDISGNNDNSSKSHKCPTCNKTFTRRSSMTRHQTTHRPREFQCQYPGCGKFFSRKDKMNDHYRSVHTNDSFMCSMPLSRRDDPDDDSDSGHSPYCDDPLGKAWNPPSDKPPEDSQNDACYVKPCRSTHNTCSGTANTYEASFAGDVPATQGNAAAEYVNEFAFGKVVRKLGHGGFGSVYEVSHKNGLGEKSGRTFACKTIRLPKRRRSEVLERAQNEINILQLLDHPHIIELTEACILADTVFINTAPVADCNLKQFLSEATIPISGRLKVQVWEQAQGLASALAYLHTYDRGVACHGDLKSENILVMHGSNSGQVKFLLADFGSATISASNIATSHGNRGMTPKYCAPECFAALNTRGPPSDIWSFGCVLSEIISYLHDKTLLDFETFRTCKMEPSRDWTYYESLPVLHSWLRSLSLNDGHFTYSAVQRERTTVIMEMLRLNPQKRPSAAEVVARFDAMAGSLAQKGH